MVKIPKLAEDGQNWKIYCAKFLEAAATYNCLEVLAGRPYEGDNWDGCNALLCCTFMESVPPSIYFPIRRRTTHENFKYLAKRFRDNDPIPHTNEFQCAGTATAAKTLENYSTSTNRDKEDLYTTKDLSTRGMEDPRASQEALAEGNSTESADGTSVLCAAMLHETPNQLQNSLQATQRRLPIEDEPCTCEQEVVESIVTAGRTKGTAQSANPPETEIADIDPEKAALGRDLAERACGVDAGDGMECEPPTQLQQMNLYCKEDCQCSGIAKEDVPSAQKLLLEGEWTVCTSGKLLTTTVEPYVEDVDMNACICLGAMRWRANDASHLGCQTDVSKGQVDGPGGLMDAPSTSNEAETDVISHGEGAGTTWELEVRKVTLR